MYERSSRRGFSIPSGVFSDGGLISLLVETRKHDFMHLLETRNNSINISSGGHLVLSRLVATWLG